MPSNNYGTGGYGLQGNGSSVGAAGSAIPLVAVARLLVGKAAQNIGGSIDDSQRINRDVNTKGEKDVNAEHSSPFGVMDEMGSQMFPGAEKMLSANTKPLDVAQAGFSVQPTDVDSSQPAYDTSGMANYLNYMKYKGGY